MKPEKATVIAALAAVALSLGAWMLLPWLQSGKRRTESTAAVHLERARRLLHQYNGELAYRSLIVDQLREAEVDVDVKDPQALAEGAADEYQERHVALWTAFEPRDWQQDPPRAVKATYGNLAGQIRDGVKARSAVASENEKLLKDALAEIESAVSSDGASSDALLFEANRLKGVIQYHRGLAERLRATLVRSDADLYRRQLAEVSNGALQWSTSRNLVAESGIDDHISRLRGEMTKGEARLAEDQKELAQLDAKMADMESRVAAAKAAADQARSALEQLQEAGVDFSDPQGGETFARQVGELDIRYREGIRRMQSLEAGDFPKAEIDASGDFLRGRYLEDGAPANLTIEHGLSHYRSERAALSARVDGRQQAVKDFRSDLSRLEVIRSSSAAAQEDAIRRVEEAGPLAADAYAELNRIESEAATIEDGALKLLDNAAGSFHQAAGTVDQWISTARDRTQNLSPETKERSAFGIRESDEWLAGHISAQIADARLAKAWVYYDRFSSGGQNADVLSAVSQALKLAEADPEAERTKAEEARKRGVEEVTKAVEVLEKAHRRAERHWTLTAQAAGTTYLLVLFGQRDYLADTIAGYHAALKGREDQNYGERLRERLKRLESR